METLIAKLTDQSIEEVQDNDFSDIVPEEMRAAVFQKSKPKPIKNTSKRDYDKINYFGRSAGICLNHGFSEAQTIRCPEHPNVEIQILPRKELLFAQLNSSMSDNNYTKMDIGFSFSKAIFKNKSQARDIATKNEPLPPLPLIRKACGLYFNYFDSLFPVVNKLKFDPRNQDIVVYAVLAVSFQFASRYFPELFKKQEVYAKIYFGKVMRYLQDMARTHISQVQAALLMVVYLDMDEGDIESLQWAMLGKAIRVAQDLGLHRSCVHWDLPTSERENRHRVFYGCFVLDRLISSRAGKPLMIHDMGFDADLPLIYEAGSQQPVYQGFISLVRICSLLGDVLDLFYSTKSELADTDFEFKDSTRISVLDNCLRHWKSETFGLETLSYAQKENLLMYYYTALLLLHRPFVENNETSMLAETSRRTCETAAYNIIVLMDKDTQEIRLPLPAFFAYAIFQSCLVHLALVLQTRDTFRLQRLAHALTLLKKTQGAYQTLNALMVLHQVKLEEQPMESPWMSSNEFFELDDRAREESDMFRSTYGKSNQSTAWVHPFIDYSQALGPESSTAWSSWPFVSPEEVTLARDLR